MDIEYMQHIQGTGTYRQVVDKRGKKRRPVEVVILAHSADGYSTVLYPNGKQQRVATQHVTMKSHD
jgi:hypothetical protein